MVSHQPHPSTLALHSPPRHYAVRSLDRHLRTFAVSDLDTFRPVWTLASVTRSYFSYSQRKKVVLPRVNRRLLYANLNRDAHERVNSMLLQTYQPTSASKHCYSFLHRGVAARSRSPGKSTRFPYIKG